jgi:hypothetical protein
MLVILAFSPGWSPRSRSDACSHTYRRGQLLEAARGDRHDPPHPGANSQFAVIFIFATTPFLPVAAAVGIGVALSLLLQLNQEAMDLAVVELIPLDGGRFEERPPPAS